MTALVRRHLPLLAAVFGIFFASTVALPLTELDRRALIAFTNGFLPSINTTQPITTLNLPPWTLSQIPNICDLGISEITCRNINATHSTIIKIYMDFPLSSEARRQGYMMSLLPEFYLFPSLEEVNLPCTTIVGPISSEIGRMTTLKVWYLEGNSYGPRANQAPTPLQSAFGNLVNLESLVMIQQFLNGTIPASFSNLTNLKFLSLEGNLLTGPLPDLSPLTMLNEINVRVNRLSGPLPTWIGTFPNITNLLFGDNQFTGNIPDVPTNGLLGIVDFSWNKLDGPLPSSLIANQPNLYDLFLQHNLLSGPIPSQAALPSAFRINLGHNRLSGGVPQSFITSMPASLQQFRLNNNRFTGPMPDLSTKSDLGELDLSDNTWSASTFPLWTITMPTLWHLRLSNCSITGDLPVAALNARDAGWYVLDLSGNFFGCPATTLNSTKVPALGCFLHENDLCVPNRTNLYQPNCATIPQICRTTPCRPPTAVNLTTASSGCSGQKVEIPSASPSLRLLFDPCFPKAIMIFSPRGTAPIELSAAVYNITEVVNDYIYNSWRSTDQTWKMEYSFFASSNNSKVIEMRYRTTLPNGATFSVPFYYYENPDSLKLFGERLTVPARTLKFGVEVESHKPSSRRGRPFIGMDLRIEASDPFLAELSDLQSFFDLSAGAIRVLPIHFDAGPEITFRIPTLGANNNQMDLSSDIPDLTDPRIQSLLNAVVSNTGILKFDLPLRLACWENMIFDPDLSLVFDFSDPPVSTPALAGAAAPPGLADISGLNVVGAIVGSLIAAAVLIAIAVVILVPSLRFKVFPFLKHSNNKLKPAPIQTEAEDELETRSTKRDSTWMRGRPSVIAE